VKILHLSDTTLSGSPIRITDLFNQHAGEHRARHIVWKPTVGYRTFKTDVVGSTASVEELEALFNWADVLHFHNRWRRQEIFQKDGHEHLLQYVADKPSVIQIHSPRFSEDFSDEAASGVPLAIIAQYHPRQWPEASYVIPNVVDIEGDEYKREPPPLRPRPIVSYAPSNTNAKSWDDKGYGVVAPILKRLSLSGAIYYQLIIQRPHALVMELKRGADIGIDEVVTGSYHLSSLEYLALGVPCFANLDELTTKTVCDVTGSSAEELPWLKADKGTFRTALHTVLNQRSWPQHGAASRAWMEKYWHPEFLVGQYLDMYRDL
jgi:hypothetical protein